MLFADNIAKSDKNAMEKKMIGHVDGKLSEDHRLFQSILKMKKAHSGLIHRANGMK